VFVAAAVQLGTYLPCQAGPLTPLCALQCGVLGGCGMGRLGGVGVGIGAGGAVGLRCRWGAGLYFCTVLAVGVLAVGGAGADCIRLRCGVHG